MAPDHLHHDFETKSEIDLPSCGLYRYATDKSTRILMTSWAVNDAPVKLWQPHEGPMPSELRDAFTDPHVIKTGWHVTFEKWITKCCLGLDMPYNQYEDATVHARYMSMPGSLEDVGRILGLKDLPAPALNDRPCIFEEPEIVRDAGQEAKIKDGSRLITMFCEPARRGGEETLFGTSVPVFRDWTTDPVDWYRFCEYCKQDTAAERTILKRMARFPLPETERQGWILDQIINDCGLPVDELLVRNAILFTDRVQAELRGKLQELTGLDNPNSNQKILEWVMKNGYPFNSIRKDWVAKAVAGHSDDMSPECKEALRLRGQLAKTSAKKYLAIRNLMGSDLRLRHQFSFLGAARSGRWQSHGTQFHNLPRGDKSVEKKLDLAVKLMREGNYEAAKAEFPSIMEMVSTLVRPAFRAPEGHKLVVCDLNAIENRVVGWLAGCDSILKVFREDKDPYLDFATVMYKQSYEELLAEYKAGNKEKRQIAKVPVLGCSYRLGGGEIIVNADGDEVKTGLMGYAATMGVDLTQAQAKEAVTLWRETYHEVVQLWYDTENAAASVLRNGKPIRVGHLEFSKIGKVLRVLLPSGRYLHYLNPKMEEREFFGSKKKMLVYDGIEQKTKQWSRIATNGGKWVENCLAGNTRVLTSKGVVLLKDVTVAHKVWDGLQWVGHGGIIRKGVQEVGNWIGLIGTKNHKILAGNSWKELGEMDRLTSVAALLRGRDSEIALSYLQSQEKKDAPYFDVIAEKNSKSQLGKFGGDRYTHAHPVLTREKRRGKQRRKDILSLLTRKLGSYGYADEPASFLDVIGKNVENTRITGHGASLFTNPGKKVLDCGWNTLSRFPTGTKRDWISIEETITETTRQEIYDWFLDRLIAIIDVGPPFWSSSLSSYHMKIFEKRLPQNGLRIPYGTICQRERLWPSAWNSIGGQEVFDLMNAGPNNRFTVLTDLGPVIVHNCTQAVARDLLLHGMTKAHEAGFSLAGHVHDELLAVVKDEDLLYLGVEEMKACMTDRPQWAPDLPLGAEGFECDYYRKG